MSQQAAAFLVPDRSIARITRNLVTTFIGSLNLQEVFEVRVSRGGHDWRATADEIELLDEYDRLGPGELAELGTDVAGKLICANFQGPLVDTVKSALSKAPETVQKWKPFLGQLRIGSHSIPDYEFEETVWSGDLSVAVYGDRMPDDPDALIDVLEAHSGWRSYAAQFQKIVGSPVVTKVEVSY
jgi:hypothetical protein